MITEILLRDQTTGRNILWANAEHGAQEIQAAQVDSIRPRHEKLREHQKQRTRDRAEIFTPPHICAKQNDLFDKLKHSWTEYIDAKFLEVTCGEAPYLVSRYNAVTGEPIPLPERIGLLDRKLRLVDKETAAPNDWLEWTLRAVQSVYGYEFQGDNLFLARRNVLETFKDYFRQRFSKEPPDDILIAVATIISCNLWQMDGLSGSPPFTDNANLFGGVNCKIMDWRTREVVEFKALLGGKRR